MRFKVIETVWENPKRADFCPKRADFCPKRADFCPKPADFCPKPADFFGRFSGAAIKFFICQRLPVIMKVYEG